MYATVTLNRQSVSYEPGTGNPMINGGSEIFSAATGTRVPPATPSIDQVLEQVAFQVRTERVEELMLQGDRTGLQRFVAGLFGHVPRWAYSAIDRGCTTGNTGQATRIMQHAYR